MRLYPVNNGFWSGIIVGALNVYKETIRADGKYENSGRLYNKSSRENSMLKRRALKRILR